MVTMSDFFSKRDGFGAPRFALIGGNLQIKRFPSCEDRSHPLLVVNHGIRYCQAQFLLIKWILEMEKIFIK